VAWTLALRFLRGHRSRLLDGTARAAVTAIALGVTAMVVAMALMTGYREGLQGQLIAGNAAILVQPLSGGEGLEKESLARLRALPGVLGVGRVTYGRGVLEAPSRSTSVEVVLRGIDPAGRQLAAREDQLATGADGLPGLVLGRELAETLGVQVGDPVRLLALGLAADRPRFRYRSLRVTGTFDTGFAEFDQSWALLHRDLVTRLLGEQAAVELYELTLEEPEKAPAVAEEVRRVVGAHHLVTDWSELNQDLFTALAVQQRILFLVLGLIVLVSTFNVASSVMVLVRERLPHFGVLAALGLDPARLRRTVVLFGAVLGALGILAGVGLGSAAAWLLDRYEVIRFNPEVAAIYFIRSVPFRLEAVDLVAIVAFALVVNLLACLLPARWVARMDPGRALRYE
jgi:lipoprotein-releasing system permease protein